MVERVWQLPLKTILAMEIKGIIFDLDDTLAPKNGTTLLEKDLEWLSNAQQSGIQCQIVSNNHHPPHVEKMAKVLNLPAVAQAKKPSPKYILKAIEEMNLTPPEVLMVGDRVLTDILGGGRLNMPTCLVKPVISIGDKSLAWNLAYRFEWALINLLSI